MAAVQGQTGVTGGHHAAPATAAVKPADVSGSGSGAVAIAQKMKPTIFQQLVLSGSACAISTFFTNPIDMMKCRLQLQMASGDAREYKGMLRGFVTVIRNEGVTTLWRGYNAAILRAYTYSATRLGMYEPVRNQIISSTGSNGFLTKLTAGVASGTIAACAGCPFELIKVRMQGKSYSYSNPLSAVVDIVRTDGTFGLWRGLVPYVVRGALLTGTQLGVYDQSKTAVKEYLHLEDGVVAQVSAAMMSGLVTTTVTQPVDMIKTRMMNYKDLYQGPLDCLRKIVRSEGLKGLYKGWVPNYARLGPHTLLTLTVYEQLRSFVGWNNL